MRRKNSIILLLFYLFFFANISLSFAGETIEKNTSAFKTFIKSYIITEKHPIFGDYQNGFSISYADCFNDYRIFYNREVIYDRHRAIHSAGFHYSQPNKLLRVHGRVSAGIFSLHGVKGIYKDLYSAVGIEIIQEIVFGTPTLYFTAGIGPSFIFAGKTGRVGKNDWGYNEYGMTKFNFSSVIRIGHRFDFKKFGGFVEISYHHYSNGSLDSVNEGVDMIGADIGIVF